MLRMPRKSVHDDWQCRGGEGKARHGDLCLRRRRLLGPSRSRAVRAQSRHQTRARALSWRRADGAVAALRRRRADVGYAGADDAFLRRRRQAARACGDVEQAAVDLPRCAGDWRTRYGNDLEVQAWQGVLVRSGTPAAIIDTLYRAIAKGMALDDPKQRIAAMAVEPMATDPAAFAAFFTSEVKRWTDVARVAGIQAQ
jgi:hypothetical protein